MSITDLPCLVINLEERKDRWQNMMKGLKDFKNVQRFDAINVKDFVLDDLPISLNAKYIINNNNQRCHHFQIHNKNAIGCSLSHIECWKYIVENRIDKMIIFEDDCDIQLYNIPNIQKEFEKCDKDIFVIGYLRIYNPTILENNKLFGDSFIGAHAYILTYQGAVNLLKYAFPIDLHVDAYIGLMMYFKHIDGAYISSVNSIKQYHSKSDIQLNYCNDCLEPLKTFKNCSDTDCKVNNKRLLKIIMLFVALNILIIFMLLVYLKYNYFN